MPIKKRAWIIYITIQNFCENLNLHVHLSLMTYCWEKSNKLSKKFRLTTLAFQSVEQFYLGRKNKISIFNNNPDKPLNPKKVTFNYSHLNICTHSTFFIYSFMFLRRPKNLTKSSPLIWRYVVYTGGQYVWVDKPFYYDPRRSERVTSMMMPLPCPSSSR